MEYALGIAGVAAVIAIVVGTWKIDPKIAVVGVPAMLMFMLVLRVFAVVSGAALTSAANVFVWFCLSLFMAFSLSLFTSVFWDYPLALKTRFFPEQINHAASPSVDLPPAAAAASEASPVPTQPVQLENTKVAVATSKCTPPELADLPCLSRPMNTTQKIVWLDLSTSYRMLSNIKAEAASDSGWFGGAAGEHSIRAAAEKALSACKFYVA